MPTTITNPPTNTATISDNTIIRPIYRCRLKAGFHTDVDIDGIQTLYKTGDVFLTRKPFFRKWPNKFERVEDYVPLTPNDQLLRIVSDGEQIDSDDEVDPISGVTPTTSSQESKRTTPTRPLLEDEQLNSMTVNELRSYAEDEEINLGNASRKEDILRAIRQYLSS